MRISNMEVYMTDKVEKTKTSITWNDKAERDRVRDHAGKRGFDGNLSAYIRWLIRQDMKNGGRGD